jgi:hypothetical protein
MAYGVAGTHQKKLKDKKRRSPRTKRRSYRLNGSGMNKIVRGTSTTLWSIERNNVHVQTFIAFAGELCVGSSVCMTQYLIAARAAIIFWTNLAVMPAEIVFDAIEAELKRRGVEL